jgi:hypothetical protein
MDKDEKNPTADRDEVARLAYTYWEERGCEHGCHEDDWHRAEQEIRKRRPDLAPPRSAERTVVGVFRSLDDAQYAFDALQREGFSKDEISFIANKAGTEALAERQRAPVSAGATVDTGAEVAADAGIGAAIGGLGGLLLGFAALAVPGVGPVIAAGPIIAALGGAGIGAAAGGLIGALTENGIPEDEARYYAEGVRRGDILITVQASGDRADLAASTLDRHHAINIDDRVSSWKKRGWTSHDTNAAPLSEAELRREREYYSSAERQGKDWARQSHAGAGSGLAGAEAANAKTDAERTSKAGRKSVGAGRRDVEDRDLASTSEKRARVYEKK